MQQYVIDNNKNTSVEDFAMRNNLITILKNRFTTYGYKQVRTSTFEFYDMYASITGTVNKDEMIKVIGPSGNVLVLRPDVTIPITRMIALNKQPGPTIERLFYVLDVYRQGVQIENNENTQAGIELFGENSPEMDSEVIMLAIHTLKDLSFKNFKIEIGHAGFFKELIQQADFTESELEQLQTMIQSKNITEIELFLAKSNINQDLQTAIKTIPLLYGNPESVMEQAEKIIHNENMKVILQNLRDVARVLKDYGIMEHVILNLGLINNMNYYSGIIFQGFVGNVGKPVLMGGRYDHLGAQFGSAMPAIGFAFDVDFLLHALQQQGLAKSEDANIDMIVYYEKEKQRDALFTAFELRDDGYQVLTFPLKGYQLEPIYSTYSIIFEKEENLVVADNWEDTFSNLAEIYSLIQDHKGDA